MFQKVLIANRGEIARRVIRSLKKAGISSVAIYSDSDAHAPHVLEADEAVYIGADPAANSYLDVHKVVQAAVNTGAEAVHPGYGFLAESLEFARALKAAEITLIGPGELALEIMGDKARSREHAIKHGVPVVPGFNALGMSDDEIVAAAKDAGFPLLLKPSAGGGGKGMQIVVDAAELPEALASARRVAKAAFGDDTLVIERLIEKPRHIEVQVFGDLSGRVVALGERECTLQRRHQKVIEEAPSIAITEDTRQKLFQAAVAAAESVNYVGAGTVEFLISALNPSEFFFIEMNTRLQVEHPVTEAVTGLDLVALQLLVAAGEKLPADWNVSGHAVEARIYAEQPENEFLPSVGKILRLHFGSDVRVDSAIEEGSEVSPFYDPMIAKVIAHGRDRAEALARLDNALAETIVLGVHTNIAFLRQLIADERVRSGDLETGLIDTMLPILPPRVDPEALQLAAIRAAGVDAIGEEAAGEIWSELQGFRLGGFSRPERQVLLRRELEAAEDPTAQADDGTFVVSVPENKAVSKLLTRGIDTSARAGDGSIWVSKSGASYRFTHLSRRAKTLATAMGQTGVPGGGGPKCQATMPGSIVALHVKDGEVVNAGDPLVSVEAMKMEHPVYAGVAGVVRLKAKIGDQVQRGTLVAEIEEQK